MNEEQAAARFLFQRLAADAGVSTIVGSRIYESLAPDEAAYPLVIFNLQSGRDVTQAGGDGRILTSPLFLVKAVTQSNGYASADELAHAIDAALEGASGTITLGSQGYAIQTIYRTAPFRFLEPADGLRYFHVGGLYRVTCYAL